MASIESSTLLVVTSKDYLPEYTRLSEWMSHVEQHQNSHSIICLTTEV